MMHSSAYDLARPRCPLVRAGMTRRRYSRHARQLLGFFVRHRTALADHVQRQLPELFRIGRTTRLHLQTLVERGDLTVAPRVHVAGPNIYLLAPRGLATWAEMKGAVPIDDTPQRRRRPTGSHLLHELFITEFAVGLAETIRRRSDLTLAWDERFELTHRPAFQTLQPDYAFLFQMSSGEQLACFVEVSAGEDSPTRLAQKLDKYVLWMESSTAQQFLIDLYRAHGAANPQPLFRLLFAMHNKRGSDNARLRQLLRQIASIPISLATRIWATTIDDLAAAKSLEDAVWIRARDLPNPRTDTSRKQTLAQIPRYPLFPAGKG